jgi:transaldolase
MRVGSATETMSRSTTAARADSPLGRTIATTATDIWNDSCSVPELEYAVSYGAVGATANPTIVMDVWKAEPAYWRDRVGALAAERPDAPETDLAWAIVEEMSLRAAPLLLPAFEATGGRQGRLSMQTDPTLFRSFDRMLAQGEHFASLAPNIIVKFPATSIGVRVMEEATYRGVSVNATVSFTVPQAIAAGEAVERGLRRREAEGLRVDDMGPVITVMMGRLEDWLRAQAERDGIVSDPSAFPWSGVAVFKRTVAEFQRRGLRARPLAAAIRHRLHWSELIGGDVIITLPAAWQRRFNGSDVEVRPRMDDPVAPAMVDDLRRHFPDFVRAHDPDGLAPDEFDHFAPSARTLRAFIGSYHELLHQVTDALIPNPDAKRA